jgi:uncharacterized cupredoxin-like copper-binding protein
MRTRGTRAAGIGALILALLLAGAGTALAAGWLERSTGVPSSRTIHIRIHYSGFEPQEIDVGPGQAITFVVENADPIDHEFIVGDEDVQHIHEVGGEAHHAPRPGEISIAAGETVVTTYTFPSQTGGLIFGCHLPGHYAYGMRGVIRIA